METEHDSLADVPINSVLIGLFSESLKTLADHDAGYPEFITIQGTGTTKATSRTYKFKTADVRHYLSGLKYVIDTMLSNFIPDTISERPTPKLSESKLESEPDSHAESQAESQAESEPDSHAESQAESQAESEPDSHAETKSEAKLDSEEEAVVELEDEKPSATNEPSMDIDSTEGLVSKSLKGGARKIPRRKLSLKKRK